MSFGVRPERLADSASWTGLAVPKPTPGRVCGCFCAGDDGLSDKWALGPFGHFSGFRIMTCQNNGIALCLLLCFMVFGNMRLHNLVPFVINSWCNNAHCSYTLTYSMHLNPVPIENLNTNEGKEVGCLTEKLEMWRLALHTDWIKLLWYIPHWSAVNKCRKCRLFCSVETFLLNDSSKCFANWRANFKLKVSSCFANAFNG